MTKNKTTLKSYRDDAVNLLYSNSYSGIFITFIASTVMVFGFLHADVTVKKLVWWFAMQAVLLLRIADILVWRKESTKADFDSLKALKRFVAGSWFSAMLWAGYSLYFYQYASNSELTFNIIIVSAMAGGAANVLAANKTLAISYCTLLILPYSLILVSSDTDYHQLLGYMGLFFSLVLVVSASKSANFTLQSIALKHQNDELLADMELKVEQRTQRIYELSHLDPLTGLYNRTAFLDRFSQRIQAEPERPMALLFIDLDGFKKVNDSIGHDTGDALLKAVASRLITASTAETLFCRWGGDEFLMALPARNQEQVRGFAEALIQSISKPFAIENNTLSISATVGIALYPDHSQNEQELIRLADMAMFDQKRRSSAKAEFFNHSLEQRLKRELQLRDRLVNAIDNQELHLAFQPVINSQSQITGAEVLLRWTLDGEAVSPAEFIPLAEQSGLIHTLGLWVAEQSFTLLSRLEGISLGLNVSLIQLQDPAFIGELHHKLTRTGIAASRVHLELTESVFAADKRLLLERVRQLQRLGFHIAIDDFGTGYSSLSMIQHMSVDTVKIDRSFVASMDTPQGQAIIDTVMQLSKALGFRVVAEGVETAEQAAALHGKGVHLQQGFWHYRPMDFAALTDCLARQEKSPS
ncbi:putative bifunctional diguanylate cyclase/phosphodiesterase [Gallaecimonas mangrovi]|uniref:putative bifunctional diguanylate cyclase/phosphodiesterase n=1 Tax=Gallaecimonas mangrovi TaxID=2291597 RepID=UPI000E204145|nr:EAL domain-containing protein [Gallaecimonas mangrovi]